MLVTLFDNSNPTVPNCPFRVSRPDAGSVNLARLMEEEVMPRVIFTHQVSDRDLWASKHSERVAAFGGDFTAGPRTSGGWRVRAEFPVAP